MTRTDPAWLLVAAVPMRAIVDLGWWIDTPAGTLGRLGSGALLVACAVLVVSRWRRAIVHPLRVPISALLAAVAAGALRADQPAEAAVWAGHLLTPPIWLLALWVAPPPPRAVVVWVAALTVPIAVGLLAAVAGQPADHVLHGWPRLLGAYGNVHTHAGVMAVGGVSALALSSKHRWAGWVALGAGVCLLLTFVRTGWIWAVVAVIGGVVAHRGASRRTLLLGASGLVLCAVLGVASGRLTALTALLTATPPEGGWSQLGSSRLHIWADTLSTFAAGPASDPWFGRGLGDHQGLHRHFDPHSEVLSVGIQLGALGLVAWLVWLGGALRLAARAARVRGPEAWVGALAFGLLLGACVTAPLSNDWLSRATVTLWTWGCLGLALRPAWTVDERAPVPTPPAA